MHARHPALRRVPADLGLIGNVVVGAMVTTAGCGMLWWMYRERAQWFELVRMPSKLRVVHGRRQKTVRTYEIDCREIQAITVELDNGSVQRSFGHHIEIVSRTDGVLLLLMSCNLSESVLSALREWIFEQLPGAVADRQPHDAR